MTTGITLSICTPSYNYARFMPDALDSVAQQGLERVEHVVVDDGSTDESVRILEKYGHPRLTWSSKPNGGLSSTLNACVELARGEWLGWLNADDYYLPGSLGAVLDTIDRDPDADFIFGDSTYVDEDGGLLGLHAQHGINGRVLRWMSTHIAPCAMFFRKSALPNHVFDEGLRLLMDWDICLGYLHQGSQFKYLPRPLGGFRRHGAQQSVDGGPGASWEEHVHVRSRFGMPRTPRSASLARAVGKFEHRVHKVVIGSYIREFRVAPLRGRDTRWFRTPEAAETAWKLVDRGSF